MKGAVVLELQGSLSASQGEISRLSTELREREELVGVLQNTLSGSSEELERHALEVMPSGFHFSLQVTFSDRKGVHEASLLFLILLCIVGQHNSSISSASKRCAFYFSDTEKGSLILEIFALRTNCRWARHTQF
jgi:hypothetical protein